MGIKNPAKFMKKKKMKQIIASVIGILLVAITVFSLFAPAMTVSAKNTPAIIYMDNNKQHYEIGEEIQFGVGLPAGVTSFEFTMGYSSSCLEMEKTYEGNRVSVDGNYFTIKAKVIGNGKLYFKVTNVKASNGYAYGSASILRYAGNGQEQEQQKISECLLSELTVNNGTLSPDFDKYVDNYWINIEDKDSITITAKAKEDGDKVSVKKDGKEIDMKDVKIEKGMETVDVIVSTEGNAKTYSLFISRNIPEEQEKPDEPVVDVPDEPEEPETPENPDKPTEEEPSTEKPKRELPFNPVVAIIIVVIAGGLIALIVIFQLKQSKKEYDESDEAYRIREEKERQKRVEQMRRERQGDQYVETKKGLFKKNK